MPTYDIRLPRPHAGQRAVLSDTSRFRIVVAGRRWRKTSLAMMACVEYALRHPGARLLWASPVYRQTEVGFRETMRAAGGAVAANKSRMEIAFPTGATLMFRSTEIEDNLRSETVDFAVVDEVADVAETAWTEVIRPMLMDTGGGALLVGTPRGRNWVWKHAMKAQAGEAGWAFYQAPSLGCDLAADGSLVRSPHPLENPHIQWHELVALWADMGERQFRQEIMAEFLDSERGVFRNVAAASTLRPRLPASGRYSMGVDLAQVNDYTAISIIDMTTRQQVHLDRFNKQDWEAMRGRIRAAVEAWRPAQVVVERNSIGGPVIDALKAEGVRITDEFATTAISKAQIIENLALALQRGEVTLLDDPVQRAELEAYERIISDHTGRGRYSAPTGLHDDTVMALALAWHGVTSRPASIWATPAARSRWEAA